MKKFILLLVLLGSIVDLNAQISGGQGPYSQGGVVYAAGLVTAGATTTNGLISYTTNAPVITGNGTATWYLTNSFGLLITNADITLSLSGTPITRDIPAVLILSNSAASGGIFTLTPSGFRIMTNGVPASAVVVTNLTAKHQHCLLFLNCYGPGLFDAEFKNFFDP